MVIYPDHAGIRHAVIAGVNKAGTSSIFTYLSEHPEICASSKKETRYFLSPCPEDIRESFIEYNKFFSHCPSKKTLIRLEATPDYLRFGRQTAERIKRVLNNVHLLFVLREPAERLYSHFRSHSEKSLLRLPSGLTFEDFVQLCLLYEKSGSNPMGLHKFHLTALRAGRYDIFLEDYARVFGSWKGINIFFYENLKNDPIGFMESICEAIGIDKIFFHNFSFQHYNISNTPRFQFFHQIAADINRRVEPFTNECITE